MKNKNDFEEIFRVPDSSHDSYLVSQNLFSIEFSIKNYLPLF